ncbi:HD-GYP domain-containing protein [Aliagarivorans marinus]|uniref:HD-GYP domain-containing protein n=1 Tax=Aliagarivorans marinus TaxID=561965 RepID=UPI00040F1B67|nr:HD-GYP domain-containing protein [Aliagarivorans marinus]
MTNSGVKLTVVPVNQLQVGMLVVGIAEQSGKASLSQSGRISSTQQIALLQKKGIRKVKVQLDSPHRFSSEPEELEEKKLPESPPQPEPPTEGTKVKAIFNEAKSLQGKYFEQLRQGEPIDIRPMEKAAGALIDSLDNNSDALLCLAKIRAKDRYLMEHSLNVGMLLAYFGRSLGMDKQVQRQLLIGGMLHDIGKIMTPDEVLHKAGRLDDAELTIMREHVVHSKEILSKQRGFSEIMIEVASNHHERLDGSGYPLGLKGNQLSVYSRMALIVDCYDALTADRVYKSGMTPTEAFRTLLGGAGTQCDKVLLEKFIRCIGVYPVGTMVKLKSDHLAVVIQRNEMKPLRPKVKQVFDLATDAQCPFKLIDLNGSEEEEILQAVSARDYGLVIDDFMER